ncbi:MAG: ParB N-terminal domain-containing protein [Lewinella sp.]|nr:ParB N-terminal domain-containing protein [Lewinella sp.]
MARAARENYDLPYDEPVLVSPDQLVLDAENPRLILGARGKPSEDAIIRQLHREGELGELLQSISSNGYLDFEPLVVLRDGSKGSYTVLEGNRRLAALKLLRDQAVADRIEIQTPDMDADRRKTLDNIRVIRVRSRADARTFIAFKHINGPHRWDSYAKAKYAAGWYREEKQTSPDASLSDIADRIGDRHDTIKRMVAAIYVLEQADNANVFSIDDRATRRFPFSHLYTALSRAEYMQYLGLEGGWSRWDPEPNPIPEDRLERLKEVLRWIYGYKPDDMEPVIRSQNPDIKHLGEVLSSQAAIAVLRSEKSLAKAHEQTTPVGEKLSTSLVAGQRALREAVSSLKAYDGKDRSLLDIAEEIKESADIVHERMKSRFEAAQAEAE